MQLSVIILNYNVRFFLDQCIHSVQKATKNLKAEIIVVDNHSIDDSCAMIKEQYPEVILIENNENLGFPKGNNIGVGIAKGEYICILNPDTLVEEETFNKIISFAEKQENLGIIGVKLIDGAGKFLPESKRGIPTPWVAFTKISGLYKKFPHFECFTRYYASHLNENQTGKVSILVGAFMFMKRSVYIDLDGFDENCFMYSDDIDLSYKAIIAGLNNYYFANTTVIHYKGESTVKNALYMKRFQEAMMFFYQKHYKKSVIFYFFMKIGAYLFVKNKVKLKNKPLKKISYYILLTKNPALGSLIENRNVKDVKIVNTIQSLKSETNIEKRKKQIEIIFDVNSFTFSEIFSVMKDLSEKSYTFKMLANNQKFIIGSDSSDGSGEVVVL